MSVYLEIPWEESKYLKLKYSGKLRPRGGSIFIYNGSNATLPNDLAIYKTEDFSYSRWLEDDARKSVLKPTRNKTQFTPRDYQKVGANAIYKTYMKNKPGFLISDGTGVGKTLTTLFGVASCAKKAGYTPENKALMLVVCPKGAIPVWRQTIQSYYASTQYLRIMIINYQQLNKLLKEPSAAKNAKKRKTKNRNIARSGIPTVDWNFIVFDEAHMLKNYPQSSTSLAAASIAKLNKAYSKKNSPFVVYSTATPGSSPLNFGIMANIIAPLLSNTETAKRVTPATWGKFLKDQQFSVKEGSNGYTWISKPWANAEKAETMEEKRKILAAEKNVRLKQRKDAKRIGQALTKPGAPFIMRKPADIAGWPEQKYIDLPLDFTPAQRQAYDEAWTTFRKWLKLTPAHSDPKGALVQELRYKQKASLLKVDSMIDTVVEWVNQDYQVYISVEYMETLDKYKKLLEAKKISCVEISGRTVKEREQERIKFQKGLAKVALCTVTAAISLHAGESLPDDTTASSNVRMTLLHDLRRNPLDTIQAAGRSHRSGQNSLAFVPYVANSVDQKIVYSFVNKAANMNTMLGTPEEEAEALEKIFRNED